MEVILELGVFQMQSRGATHSVAILEYQFIKEIKFKGRKNCSIICLSYLGTQFIIHTASMTLQNFAIKLSASC
jgi:hypothetical protein